MQIPLLKQLGWIKSIFGDRVSGTGMSAEPTWSPSRCIDSLPRMADRADSCSGSVII